MLGVDSEGLDEGDEKFLMALVELFDGGPVGLSTLAAALNEDTQTMKIYMNLTLYRRDCLRGPREARKARGTHGIAESPVSPHFVRVSADAAVVRGRYGMQQIGKILLAAGLVITFAGFVLLLANRF